MARVTHEINSTFATTLDHDKLVGSAAYKNRHKASRLLLSISTAARKPATWNPVTSASKPPENYTDAFLGPAVYRGTTEEWTLPAFATGVFQVPDRS